jgi:hypothetical protein
MRGIARYSLFDLELESKMRRNGTKRSDDTACSIARGSGQRLQDAPQKTARFLLSEKPGLTDL